MWCRQMGENVLWGMGEELKGVARMEGGSMYNNGAW